MTPSLVLVLFALLYFAHLAVETLLDVLNIRHLARNKSIPPSLSDFISPEVYEKSIAYTRAKTHFGFLHRAFSAILTWALILSGAFSFIDHWFSSALAYPLCIGAVLYVAHLPFSIYNQFVLEQRFGFNKSSARTFVLDQIKGMALALLFGIPLLLLIYWFLSASGTSWWLWAFCAWTGFQLLTAALFPVFLAPLFFKFTLLPHSSLRDKILAVANKIQFKMADVFTIDGSRRSSHSNAFFAGFGKTRRVVLFDTLMTSLSEDEIVAVVAHEMGHDKLKHIQRHILMSTIGSFIAFYVLSLAIQWPLLYQAFFIDMPKDYIGLVLFALFAGVLTFPLQPLSKLLSRKAEYEADAFSLKTTGDNTSLKEALKKLAKDNLSNLTPHPWYSFYHYSHPALVERLHAIDLLASKRD